MSCESCSSAKQAEVTTEMMLHVKSVGRVIDPGVFIVSKILMCFDCGFSKFNVSETELRRLREANAKAA